MGIRNSLRQSFGLTQGEFPIFKYRGAEWHFRIQTPGDEKWAITQAALGSLVSAEASLIQDHLITLVCVVKQVEGGEVSYPWREFIDREKLEQRRNKDLLRLLEVADQNPEAPPAEVQRAGALGFLHYLDDQPSGFLQELVEFYTDRIKPLGDSIGLTRYICLKCADSVPGYEPPIRETAEKPPHCELCGAETVVHTVIRRAAGGSTSASPLA